MKLPQSTFLYPGQVIAEETDHHQRLLLQYRKNMAGLPPVLIIFTMHNGRISRYLKAILFCCARVAVLTEFDIYPEPGLPDW